MRQGTLYGDDGWRSRVVSFRKIRSGMTLVHSRFVPNGGVFYATVSSGGDKYPSRCVLERSGRGEANAVSLERFVSE